MSTTTTDPIADMRKTEIVLPHSNIKESVAKLLKESNFIDSVSVKDDRIGKLLTLKINDENSNPRITEIVRVSKPGRRYYVSAQEIPTVKRGRGVVIVSTSKGLMTGDKAKTEHVGGELICKVY
jgi:small subunit ribosomal protein S8